MTLLRRGHLATGEFSSVGSMALVMLVVVMCVSLLQLKKGPALDLAKPAETSRNKPNRKGLFS
jgi:hypothetical protein